MTMSVILILFAFTFIPSRLGAADTKQADTPHVIKIEAQQIVINQPVASEQKKGIEKKMTDKLTVDEKKEKGLEVIWGGLQRLWDQIVLWWQKQRMAIGILFVGLLLTMGVVAILDAVFVKVIINHFAEKTETKFDDMVVTAVRPPLKLFIFSIGLLCSAVPLLRNLQPTYFEIALRIIAALAATSVAVGCYRLVTPLDFFMTKLASRTESRLDDLLVALFRKVIKVTLIIVSILFIGQSILGLNITALVAGAGICGLAIAFASKDAIANVFGSVTIILDRPFMVGDRVKINGVNGTVEHVGFRSTRLRTLEGCLVTVPNNMMATSAIENFSARPYIKFFANLGVTYDTPPEKVARAMEILHEIFDNHKGQDEELPPRIYFNSFNDFSLNIMVITWYHPGDYFEANAWMNDCNLEILKRFNAEGIEFAFPTSTTYLAGDTERPLEVSIKQ